MSGKRFCARAPVRVDPAGGGTDAPPFSIEHGGRVVNFGVARYAYASFELLPRGSGVTISAEELGAFSAPSVAEFDSRDLEFIQAFVRRLVAPGVSCRLDTRSDVPPGSGLGGSGALGVAVVAAIESAYGREHTRAEIANLANSVERDDLKAPGGNQDSYGAAFGGINDLEYAVGGGTTRQAIDVPDETRFALERDSLLIYTSEAHVSGSIHEDIKRSYALEDSPTLDAMRRLRESAERMVDALREGRLDRYIAELNESCRHLYRLHPSCDSDAHRRYFRELDPLLLGGKTCGAGGGGFMLVAARSGRRRECEQRVKELGGACWPLAIDFDGVRTWTERSTST